MREYCTAPKWKFKAGFDVKCYQKPSISEEKAEFWYSKLFQLRRYHQSRKKVTIFNCRLPIYPPHQSSNHSHTCTSQIGNKNLFHQNEETFFFRFRLFFVVDIVVVVAVAVVVAAVAVAVAVVVDVVEKKVKLIIVQQFNTFGDGVKGFLENWPAQLNFSGPKILLDKFW